MKLIETAFVILIMPLIFSLIFPAFRKASELHGISLEISKNLERDSFLTNGFYDLVLKNNGSAFEKRKKIREFCEMCGALWRFDSLKIEEISDKSGNLIFKCCWKAGEKENYALSILPSWQSSMEA